MHHITGAIVRIQRFARDENGTETLEWGLVASLVVIGAIAAITLIGPKVKTMWDSINAQIP
jgi:Flp pilus assembly pilin Flp